MTTWRIDLSDTEGFLPAEELDALAPAVAAADRELREGTSPGAEYLGWLDLPGTFDPEVLDAIIRSAEAARDDSDIYVVIGIGGSYLGARAVLESLAGADCLDGPEVLFAGTGLCGAALTRVLKRCEGRRVRLCVISKSGTTLEPGVAFRVLRGALQEAVGREEAARRITAITDVGRGALRGLADAEGWDTFVIPDDVGGRFSVLTPVGLLPLAVAGVDIRGLLEGAAEMRRLCAAGELRDNPAHLYAAARHGLYGRGYTTEILSTFHSDLPLLQEWWKQLFGESEGKDGRGTFPASALFTTDLHSIGQYIQDGRRNLLETFLFVRDCGADLKVPAEPGGGAGLDGLDYLVGRGLDDINRQAFLGTRNAHVSGGVPCLTIEVDRLDAPTVGGLIYFFEKAVAISGRLHGVNPFDQPGVEAYKTEMFRLLGRP